MDSLAIQGYLRKALGNWPPLQDLIGQKIYDAVPPSPDPKLFPYVVIGNVQIIDQSRTDCVTDWEATATVDVWSREVGFPNCKRIAKVCDDALAERYPAINGYRVGWFQPSGQRFLRDPDGITSHGVLEYTCRYGPTSETVPVPGYSMIWEDHFTTFQMRSGGPTYDGLASGKGVWTPTHHTTYDPKGSFFTGEYAYMVDPTYPWGGGYPALGQFKVENSVLRMRAERTPAALQGQLPINPVTSQEFSWVSAAMTTYESLNIGPPCYIEARVKLPRGKALWPALWHIGIGNWPGVDHQEIDLFEQYQTAPLDDAMALMGHGTLVRQHSSDPMIVDWADPDHGVGDLSLAWHVWGMHFTNTEILYYLDNVLVRTQTTPSLLQDVQVNLIFDLAVGGGPVGVPDGTTPSPADLLIDWIRLWAPNRNTLWTNGI